MRLPCPSGVQYVLALTRVEDHFEEIIAAMAPYGGMVLIENPAKLLDLAKMKPKSLSLHWEYMFGPAHFQSASMAEQGRILTEVAALVDAGVIRSTICTNFGVINAENMKLAHAAVESGKTLGKIVLWGF